MPFLRQYTVTVNTSSKQLWMTALGHTRMELSKVRPRLRRSLGVLALTVELFPLNGLRKGKSHCLLGLYLLVTAAGSNEEFQFRGHTDGPN